MEYNSTRSRLILPEYGRHMQNMVDQVLAIADREKRTAAARFLVASMAQLAPAQRDFADYKRKLWDHLYIMSDFKLDVDSPYPAPQREDLQHKPQPVSYNYNRIRYRHHGKLIQDFIAKAIEMEEGPAKEAMTVYLANQLKKSYLTWNRDTVHDEVIENQLGDLSEGQLKLGDNRLSNTKELIGQPKPWNPNQNNRRKPNNNYQNNRHKKRK